MKFNSIDIAFEWMRDGYGYSEAIADCLNAYHLGISCLESHLDIWLYIPDDFKYESAEDEQYAQEIKRIEGLLVESGLIYND